MDRYGIMLRKRFNVLRNLRRWKIRRASLKGNQSSSKMKNVRIRLHEDEPDYPYYCSVMESYKYYKYLPDSMIWNVFICTIAVTGILLAAMAMKAIFFDITYSIIYLIHVSSFAYDFYIMGRLHDNPVFTHLSFVLDFISFSYYTGLMEDEWDNHKLICYFIRMHRPFRFLWSLNDYHLKVSIMGTVLKYFYYLIVLRIFWGCVWLRLDEVVKYPTYMISGNLSYLGALSAEQPKNSNAFYVTISREGGDETMKKRMFLIAVYIVNKMFIPIGPSVYPTTTLERITCLLVMTSGCLIVSGLAIATITSVISVYQSPQETFKARFRLIMKEIHQSHVPPKLRAKVETFYNMYWHKQKAVSTSALLQTFPPCLPVSVHTDIYFEALLKNRMFRDLSSQFLSEIAKKMQSIHYIPGDVIIKRSLRKSSMIYITYGDIEMLTAEDDNTAILDMTRGTLLSGLSAFIPIACTRAHVQIRASTFCTAQVLNAYDLWKITHKHGTITREGWVMLDAFYEHFDSVMNHYSKRAHDPNESKSSIVNFKHNLLLLKQLTDSNGKFILARSDKFLEVAKSYVMRNTANKFVKEESDEICLRSTFPCILQPYSSLTLAWQTFICLLALFVTIMYPYYLVFHLTIPMSFRVLDYVISIVFITDLIVHLSTGVNVEAGVPITFAQTSTQQMNSFWFVLDVLAALPIFEFVGTGYFAGMNKLLKLHKVFMFLQNLQKEFVYHSNILKLTFYTVLTLIACYIIAALQQGFMCFQFNYCQVKNFTHSPYWAPSKLNDNTVLRRMSFAMFWAISLINFVGHLETFGTENWNTVLYTIVVLEICIILHILIESFYSASIMVSSALREGYDACIQQAKNFLIRNEVDPVLRQRFTKYLELSWYVEKGYSMTNKRSIFYDLPPHVYQDIVARNRSKYILSIPFMKYLHPELLKSVSSKAVMFYTSPNEILLHTGDISNEIYVVKQGICEVLDPVTKTVVKVVEQKGYFGLLESVLRIPAYYTVRAASHVQLFSISRRHLLAAFESTPAIGNAIEFTKDQPEYKKLLNPRQRFLKYEPPAKPENKMYFKLPRKHQKDKAFQEPFSRFGTLVILKYIFPRYTIRPDGVYIKRYEWFRAFCAFLSAFVVPGYAYLILQFPRIYYVLMALDLSAYYDILQRYLVGYFDNRGILIWHPAATASHYFKGAFITDVFACLPFESLDTNSAWTQIAPGLRKISHLNQYLMFNRLIQLYRLPSVMIVVTEIIDSRDVLVVIKSLPYILVFFNVLTCLLVLESVQFTYDDNHNYFINTIMDDGKSWINIFQNTFRFNLTERPFNVHLGCYFWIVYEGTGTGYGVMNPTSTSQMWLLFIAMFIGGMSGTYMNVKIISIRGNVNKTLAAYEENMQDLSIFMTNENIDYELQHEMTGYYTYNWDKQSGVDYRNVLKLCDQITLRTDAILHLYASTFAKCPLLANCDSGFIRILGRAISSIYFLKNTRIFEADDVLSDLYFIENGVVTVRNDSNEAVAKLGVGSIFGNLVCDLYSKSSVAAITTTDVHLLRINGGKFWDITSEIPGLRKRLRNYIMENKHYIEVSAESAFGKQSAISVFTGDALWNTIKKIYHSPLPQIYLVVVCFLSIYMELLNAGYQINTTKIIIALYLLDVAFVLKIAIQILVPAHFITGKKKQKLSYYEKDLFIDVLSSVPLELLSLKSSQNFSLLRLNRILRVVTIVKCFRHYHERLGINLILTTLSNMTVWLVLFIHANACFFYYIALSEEAKKPKSSWLYKDNGEAWCTNNYVCSIYFIITTFTQYGVGDVMPKTHNEVIFASYFQIVSMMLYMVYVGEFSNLIFFRSYRSFSFFKMYLELLQYMKNNKVSSNLVKVVSSYCHHIWRESRGEQFPYFINTAPHGLKLKIMSAAYMTHLTSNPIFAECEPAFLRQLVGFLKLYSYTEDLFIVKEGEITDAMYFIHAGHILQIKENARKSPVSLYMGQYFGAMQGLQWDIPYDFSYQAQSNSLVLTLNLEDWIHLLSHYPKSKENIYKNMLFDDDDNAAASESARQSKMDPSSSKYRISLKAPHPLQISRSNSKFFSQAFSGSLRSLRTTKFQTKHEKETKKFEDDVESGRNLPDVHSSETITNFSNENESLLSTKRLSDEEVPSTAVPKRSSQQKPSQDKSGTDLATTSNYDKALVLREKSEHETKIQSLISETKKMDEAKSLQMAELKTDKPGDKAADNVSKTTLAMKKTSFKLPSTANLRARESSSFISRKKISQDATSTKSLVIYKDDKPSTSTISDTKDVSAITLTPSDTANVDSNETKSPKEGSKTEIEITADDSEYVEEDSRNTTELEMDEEGRYRSKSPSFDGSVKSLNLSVKKDTAMTSDAYMKVITDEIEASIGPIREEHTDNTSIVSNEHVSSINENKRDVKSKGSKRFNRLVSSVSFHGESSDKKDKILVAPEPKSQVKPKDKMKYREGSTVSFSGKLPKKGDQKGSDMKLLANESDTDLHLTERKKRRLEPNVSFNRESSKEDAPINFISLAENRGEKTSATESKTNLKVKEKTDDKEDLTELSEDSTVTLYGESSKTDEQRPSIAVGRDETPPVYVSDTDLKLLERKKNKEDSSVTLNVESSKKDKQKPSTAKDDKEPSNDESKKRN